MSEATFGLFCRRQNVGLLRLIQVVQDFATRMGVPLGDTSPVAVSVEPEPLAAVEDHDPVARLPAASYYEEITTESPGGRYLQVLDWTQSHPDPAITKLRGALRSGVSYPRYGISGVFFRQRVGAALLDRIRADAFVYDEIVSPYYESHMRRWAGEEVTQPTTSASWYLIQGKRVFLEVRDAEELLGPQYADFAIDDDSDHFIMDTNLLDLQLAVVQDSRVDPSVRQTCALHLNFAARFIAHPRQRPSILEALRRAGLSHIAPGIAPRQAES